jgi:8-oxo-dGTP diphosphatase
MLKNILGGFWRNAPKFFRKFLIRFSNQRFAVTVGAIIIDDENRVLLLKHVFRPGSGWGIPGGFINKAENPEKAVRRELAEEIGLKVENVRIVHARTFRMTNQVEILFRATPVGTPNSKSIEIADLGWFRFEDLPHGLNEDQKGFIEGILNGDPL